MHFPHPAHACPDTKPGPRAHALVTSVSNKKLFGVLAAEGLGGSTREGSSIRSVFSCLIHTEGIIESYSHKLGWKGP